MIQCFQLFISNFVLQCIFWLSLNRHQIGFMFFSQTIPVLTPFLFQHVLKLQIIKLEQIVKLIFFLTFGPEYLPIFLGAVHILCEHISRDFRPPPPLPFVSSFSSTIHKHILGIFLPPPPQSAWPIKSFCPNERMYDAENLLKTFPKHYQTKHLIYSAFRIVEIYHKN